MGICSILRELNPGLCNNLEGWDGEEGGREGTYVYLRLMYVNVCQKSAQFCKVVILQLKKTYFQ